MVRHVTWTFERNSLLLSEGKSEDVAKTVI